MKTFAIITIIVLCYICCQRPQQLSHMVHTTPRSDTFYKVTNRPLSRYFKNPADSVLLGTIVPTGLLAHNRFMNDTLRQFLKKIGLCNDDISNRAYIPCDPHFVAIIPLNDKKPSKCTLIGYTNHLQDSLSILREDDNEIFTRIFINKEYSYTIFAGIIGYYIDEIGNKVLVTHSEKSYFPETTDRNTEYIDSTLVLYKWQNQHYIPDSILTIKGNLIPKAEYEQKYRYRVHTLQ